MSKFAKGDIVKCICDSEYGRITFGRTYKVSKVTDNFISFIDDSGEEGCWLAERFELVEPRINAEAILDAMEKQDTEQPQPKKTGGSTPNQYRLSVNLPLTSDRTQFVDVDLEAMDVSDALDLSGNLRDVQKALFRMGKKDGVSEAYDFNKQLFCTLREMKKRGIISHAKFWEATQALERVLNDLL